MYSTLYLVTRELTSTSLLYWGVVRFKFCLFITLILIVYQNCRKLAVYRTIPGCVLQSARCFVHLQLSHYFWAMAETALHIGRKISRIRELRGMKQEALALELGISQQAVSKIEQSADVEDEALTKIASILGVSIEAIKNFS